MGPWTSASGSPFLLAAYRIWCVRNAIPKLFLSQALLVGMFVELWLAADGCSLQQNVH